MKYFPGISHAIVKTANDARAMELYNAVAIVFLCFTDDNDYITMFIRKLEGQGTTFNAYVPKHNTVKIPSYVSVPGVSGKPADELKLQALVAFDKVMQKHGLKYHKKYKVFEKTIEEVVDAQCSTGVAQQPTA